MAFLHPQYAARGTSDDAGRIGGFARGLSPLLRLTLPGVLTLLVCLPGLGPAPALAADDDTADWPSEVAVPDNTAAPPSPHNTLLPAKKRSFWRTNPFKKEPPPPSEEKIINVGPRVHPANAGHLLRLPRAVRLPEGARSQDAGSDAPRVLAAGFYLTRIVTTPGAQRCLHASMGGKLMAKWTLYKADDGPEEPVTPIRPDAPVPSQLGVRLSPDGQTLVITLQEGSQRFESDPLPVVSDARPELTY